MSSIWTIRRSATDAKLTGLCGGVAQHWGVDPLLVRVGWVLLALSGGIGLALYVAGWLLIPVEGRDKATVEELFGEQVAKWPKEAWVAIVVVACVLTFAVFGWLTPIGFGPAVVLAIIWYFGYYKNRNRTDSATPGATSVESSSADGDPPTALHDPGPQQPFHHPGPATPFTEAAEAWRQRMADMSRRAGTRGGAGGSSLPESAETRPAASRSETSSPAFPAYEPPTSSGTAPVSQHPMMDEPTPATAATMPSTPDPVGPVPGTGEQGERIAFLAVADPVGLYSEPETVPVVAVPSRRAQALSRSARRLRMVALVVLGLTLSGLGLADYLGAHVPVPAYVAASLLVVGLTLVAATWLGRARGILPIGLLLLVGLVGTAAAAPPVNLQDWNQRLAYRQVSEIPAAGNTQDFGKLTVDLRDLSLSRDAAYRAHVRTGSLEVLAPTDINVVVRYHAGAGVVVVNSQPVVSGTDQTGEVPASPPKPGKPTLTLHLSVDRGEMRVSR